MKVDFHVHTIYSPDSLSRLPQLIARAQKLGLGKLVISDHNTIRGALAAKELAGDFIIVGEEIKTDGGGEVLAFFVKEEVPHGLTPLETLKRLKDQDAFISLSHPYAAGRMFWREDQILEYMDYLDAIEIANARCTRSMNNSAAHFAEANDLPGTAGSDAHGVPELGQMGLELPSFSDAQSLRVSIRQAKVFGVESSYLTRFYSRLAYFSKKLGFIRQP